MIAVLVALIAGATLVALSWILRPAPPAAVVAAPAVRSVLDERLLSSVVVTLKSGTAFAGVLYVEDAGAVVLCKAAQVQHDGTRVSADGEVVLLREDIDFIQRP